jgi:hypothetical protein
MLGSLVHFLLCEPITGAVLRVPDRARWLRMPANGSVADPRVTNNET